MKLKRIQVSSAAGRYSVVCGIGLLQGEAGRAIADLGKFSSVHVLSSKKVWRALGKHVKQGIPAAGGNNLHLFDDAEAQKNLQTVGSLCRSLTRAGADRKSLIVAVGGGVVGDTAGYVAASYLRGVAVVHIPTTLVAQVDSAIGGKTGVNLPEGKNLVGAFYPPRLVIADFETLRTLPDKEFRSGLAEVIKYGIIADQAIFSYLTRNMDKVLRRDEAALGYLIPRCVQIKAQVVSRDERESGLREILNFGHTVGHALESVTKYRRYLHGEAVAWGMMVAALLGHEIGVTAADDVSRLVSVIRGMGRLPSWPKVSTKKLIDAMRADKKTHGGKLRFVLSPRIGEAKTYNGIPLDAVERVLRFAPQVLDGAGKFDVES
ncbi:MAG: 3-dehydroquinate synthase [Acidobacteriota bacterium]|nr:3-dehydroquinate synthase [Acidobacteriota bacterium]